MKPFFSFVIKETKHILRDKRTMLMLFGMPIVMMLLFGFAVTNDVRNVRVVIVMSNADNATQQVADRLAASEYFTLTKVVTTPNEAEKAIRDQKADMAIVFSQDFASRKAEPRSRARGRTRRVLHAPLRCLRRQRHQDL